MNVDRICEREERIPRTLTPQSYAVALHFVTGKTVGLAYLPHGASLSVLHEAARCVLGVIPGLLSFKSGFITDSAVVNVVLRLRAGKGGFGNALRASGKNASQKTVNFDACKNLNGERIRHQRQLDALKKWAAGDDDADDSSLVAKGGMLSQSELRKRKTRHASMLNEQQWEQSEGDKQKQKKDTTEQYVREGFASISSQAVSLAEEAKNAVLLNARKRKGGVCCPLGHTLVTLKVGRKGENTTGFDFNICDECDCEIENEAFRCAECDYDTCGDCKTINIGTKESTTLSSDAEPKKKRTKKIDFGLDDLSDDSDE